MIVRSNKARKNIEQFKFEANKVHYNKYDYSKVIYKNCDKKVIIICPKHGHFKQTPSSHLSGGGCFECVKDRLSLGFDEFVKRAKKTHGDKYNYSKVSYKNSITRVCIICKVHGEFYQTPYVHLIGSGCKRCADNYPMSQEDFIRKAKKEHGNRYDYSKAEYKKAKERVVIICKKHGEFEQAPTNHLSGKGCPYCRKKSEGKVKTFLLDYFSDWIIVPNKKIWDSYKDYNRKRFCDFWLEKDNIKVIVEYDGTQHFQPVRFGGISPARAEKNFKHTQLKALLDHDYCLENNIILYRIKYDEDKEESIKRLLLKYNLFLLKSF